VVSTIGWLIDPDTKIVTKANWSFIAKVEKLGDLKVRITTRQPTPYDLMRLAYFTPIYPEHVFGKMTDKTQFGLKPVGTGPYKAVTVDLNKGIIVERNEDYKWGGKAKPQNNFKRFEVRGIGDSPPHVARYLAGETDFVQVVAVETLQQILASRGSDPHFTVRTGAWQFMIIPSSGQKLNPALANPKVRQAIMMAVDRSQTEKLRSDQAVSYKSLCENNEPGCGFTKAPPAYDPAAAKKLLAEAGYANGFDIEITCSSNSGSKNAAELVASYLSQVGIRPKLAPMITVAMRQKLAEGKIEMMVNSDAVGMMPDISAQVLRFLPGVYFDDPKIAELARKSSSIMDDKERRKATAELLDYVTDQNIMAPLNAQSRFYVTTKDVDLKHYESSFYPEGWAFRQLNWKK
jgi:peptide/nickel transport system substrate-binding protein